MSACDDAAAGGVIDVMIAVPAPAGEQAEKFQQDLTVVREHAPRRFGLPS